MPDDPHNPFAALGLPRRFDLDPAALQRAYLARAAAIHPDLAPDPHGPAPDASAATADLNLARQTLEDPERRADALLLLRGGPSRESDRSLPDGFLAQMMDTREQMESAHARGDSAALAGLQAWANDRRAQHIQAVAALFAQLPDPPTPAEPADLRAIRRELNAWRYIERMLEQVHAPGA